MISHSQWKLTVEQQVYVLHEAVSHEDIKLILVPVLGSLLMEVKRPLMKNRLYQTYMIPFS